MNMHRDFMKQFLQRITFFISAASILLVVSMAEIQAAKPPPISLSCTISPADILVNTGVATTFTGSTQGGKGSKSYN